MSQTEKPLKVAYLLDRFPALSETFILNEIIELKRLGLDISIFSLSKPNKGIIHKEAQELTKETCYFSNFGNLSNFKKTCIYLYVHFYFLINGPFGYLKVFWFAYTVGKYKYVFSRFRVAAYFAFILKNSNVSHIHAHFADTASEYAMLVSMFSGIPFSFTIHAHDVFHKFRLIKEKVEFARFVIAISAYNKKFVKERCPQINEDKIHVIHCGVNLKKIAISTSNGNNGERPFLILSVGRFVEKKGFKHLLEACGILVKKGISNFMCKIVGHGPQRGELEDLTLSLGLAGIVQFLGPLPNEKVFSILEGTDLFVLPCVIAQNGEMDGIPVSLMEAMGLEKPVISTCISGIPELVKDGAGILVPHGNSKSLAEAIGEIYSMDIKGRKRMGQKGREIIEMEFNIEKESKKIKDLFLSSLQETENKEG